MGLVMKPSPAYTATPLSQHNCFPQGYADLVFADSFHPADSIAGQLSVVLPLPVAALAATRPQSRVSSSGAFLNDVDGEGQREGAVRAR